jgi:predicted dinucleotide-binding enzyme
MAQSICRRRLLEWGAATPLVMASAGMTLAAETGLKIGMIGAGHMGGGLGKLWAEAGHRVMYSSRNPSSLAGLVSETGHGASAGTVKEAIAFADVVVLAVPYSAVPQIVKEHGVEIAQKRLVLDVANPLEERDGAAAIPAREMGAGAYLASVIPGVKVVRAFNSIGSPTLPRDRRRKGIGAVAVPIVGDDEEAIALAQDLIRQIDYEPVLIGGLAMSKHLIKGGPMAGERSVEEVREIAKTLK